MRLMLVLWLFPAFASAQPADINLESFCAGRLRTGAIRLVEIPDGLYAFRDQGFCGALLATVAEDAARAKPNPALDALRALAPEEDPPPPKARWKVRIYASHSFTTYFRTDIAFNSSRYDLIVKDYEWAERSSREYFKPKTWAMRGNNPAQVFDEPTNTYVASIERDGHEFYLSAFHPKFFQRRDQIKDMSGTIDGVPVSGFAPVDKPFDGYDQVPGESELTRNENTYREMIFEVGYGRRFVLFDSRFWSISYIPAVGAGVAVGSNLSAVVREGEWWELDQHDDRYRVQGIGGSITNRIEVDGPKGRVGIFYENKLSYYKMSHGFLDGTQTYDLKLMGNSVGIKVLLRKPGNPSKRRRASP